MKSLAEHILDLTTNGVEAGATVISVELRINADGHLSAILQDNGTGMAPEELASCFHPFYTKRKTRHVGLGLALIEQHSLATGGQASITSCRGKGTSLAFDWNLRHPDVLPCGDLASCFVDLLSWNPEVMISLHLLTPEDETGWDSEQIREIFGAVSLNQSVVRSRLTNFLTDSAKAFYQYWQSQKIEITELKLV